LRQFAAKAEELGASVAQSGSFFETLPDCRIGVGCDDLGACPYVVLVYLLNQFGLLDHHLSRPKRRITGLGTPAQFLPHATIQQDHAVLHDCVD
jgi:hypothetical protein